MSWLEPSAPPRPTMPSIHLSGRLSFPRRRCRCPSVFLPPPLPNSPLAESSGLVRHPHLHMHRSLRCIQGERLDGVRAHDRFGSSSHVLQNGLFTHPQDLDGPQRGAAQCKINAYGQQYDDNHNISFLPVIMSTSCRSAPQAQRQAHRSRTRASRAAKGVQFSGSSNARMFVASTNGERPRMFVASTHGERRHVDYSALEHRNSRVAAYVAAGLRVRAHWRAGQQNAHNFPAHPTSHYRRNRCTGSGARSITVHSRRRLPQPRRSTHQAHRVDTAAPPF